MEKTLKKETLDFIELNGFKELTSVQKTCLNYIVSNKDVVLIAKTGTGKTHAYLIPIMERINTFSDKTQVLISLPTRELAYQVYEDASLMKQVLPDLRISLLRGGDDKKRTIDKINSNPHIIIGTPGRIKDLFLNNIIRVDFVQTYIIDEADMTLDYGFLEDIDYVFKHMVKNPQVLCFSATFPESLKHFIKKYLKRPNVLEVKDKKRDPRIEHILVACKHRTYEDTFLSIIKGFKPYICMIFANSKEEADNMHKLLNENNYRNILLHGGLEARERNRALKAIKNNEYTYVVCSDVAARGIDIEGVSHVVSMGFPNDLSYYIHRAGRTGRNNSDGICYALYKPEDIKDIKSLKERGISFKAKTFKNGEWKVASNPIAIRNRKFELNEKEIAKTLKRKNEKVKPNYKKKKNQEIERIKRQKKRDYIKQKIKEERKERYKKSIL